MNRLTGYKRLLALAALNGCGAPVEDTVTGNPVTFETELERPMKSLIAKFLPVQASGTPSPENVLPITGWTGVNVEHFDENLLAINRTSAQTNQGITYTPIKQDNKTVAVHVTGQRTNNNPFFNLDYINGTTNAIPPGTYKIFGGTAKVRFQVFYKDSGGNEQIAGYDDGSGATVTIPSDATASWCRLLVFVDTTVDTVIYPIIMSTDSVITLYPVTWSTSGTIYGGYVDLVTGEVWKTWERIDLGSLSWANADTSNYRLFYAGIDDAKDDTNLICEQYATKSDNNSNNSIRKYKTGSGVVRVSIHDDRYNSVGTTSFKTAMEGIYIATTLAEPVLITTLTPQQINAIKGNNTVYSDANGDCSVTFLKKG